MSICSSPPAALAAGRAGWAKTRGRTATAGAGALGAAARLSAGRFTSRAFFERGEVGRDAGWRPAEAGAVGAGSCVGPFALIAWASFFDGFTLVFGTG